MTFMLTILTLATMVSAQYRQLAGSSGSIAGHVSSEMHGTHAIAGQPVVGNSSGGDYGSAGGLGELLRGTIISLDAPDGPEPLPLDFSFPQNFPNPFNPSTIFQISLPKSEHVRLIMYDRLGREAQRVMDNVLAAGAYTIHFDAPPQWSSGIYFAVLDAGAHHVTRKIVLLK